MNALTDQLKPRGSNHVGMRQFNERVVLQAVRLNSGSTKTGLTHSGLAKADLARLTKLSTQTVGMIIDRLLDDRLVIKLEPLRGRIGQPSVPIAINPDGAFSIGIKIGRRSLDILLIDFVGDVRARYDLQYAFPDPVQIFKHIEQSVAQIQAQLGTRLSKKLAGIGVALPFSLSGWQPLLGVSKTSTDQWQKINVAQHIESLTGLTVQVAKDTSAACVAELVSGIGQSHKSFLYVFVDTFIGGGLVLESRLHTGINGNAGAIGSLPLRSTLNGHHAAPAQLLSEASLFNLEELYRIANIDVQATLDQRAMNAPWRVHTDVWIDDAAAAIAFAVQSGACFLDIECVVIDGSISRELLSALIQAVQSALSLYSWEGVHRPELLAGTIGSDARALGGALLPLYANFSPDQDLFLKLDAG